MSVVEKTVGSPGERFGAPVQVVVCGGFEEFTAVLVLKVLKVSSVLSFGVVDPCGADGDAWQANKVADLPPQIGGFCGVVSESLVLSQEFLESGGVLDGGIIAGTARSSAQRRAEGVPDCERHD